MGGFFVGNMASVAKITDFPSLPEIKSKLPNDCFRSELGTSIYYVIRSAIFVASLFTFAYLLLSPNSSFEIQSASARTVVWCVYWYLQGTIFWGIFVLGHDCGHASFSKYPVINYIFGNILHSFILVPYESWKTTHHIHHKNTGNIDKDEIFHPQREVNVVNLSKRYIVGALSLAWIAYLYGEKHLSPFRSIYDRKRLVVASSIGWWFVGVLCVLWACFEFELDSVFHYYFAPLLVFMAWLVLTTFLHHQDVDAPWYGNTQWTYVKGNLSSIDRSYGFIIDNLIHDIGTHQIHHLFPKIPHYKLRKATVAFRQAYPNLVRKSDENNLPAFFNNWIIYCRYAFAPKGMEYFCYR